jgi:mannose/fructose/N-acetylgalactosamine-specific phosphotransferase system component IIC
MRQYTSPSHQYAVVTLTHVYACAQAMHAVQELQRNIAAEAAAISHVGNVFCAVVTPHQSLRGDLAAWPHNFHLLRLLHYLGAGQAASTMLSAVACLVATQQVAKQVSIDLPSKCNLALPRFYGCQVCA